MFNYFYNMIKKFFFFIFFIFTFPHLIFCSNFHLVYNSPNFNIYISKKYKNGELLINGKIENLYYVPIIDITGYVEAISNKKIIEKKEFFISYLGQWEDQDSKKDFKIIFSNGAKIQELKFTINFSYASWKESSNNYEYFTIKLHP